MARARVAASSRSIPAHLGAITVLTRPADWLGSVASWSNPPACNRRLRGAGEASADAAASWTLETSARAMMTHAPDVMSAQSTSAVRPERPRSVRCVAPLRTSQAATSWPRPPRPPVTIVAPSAARGAPRALISALRRYLAACLSPSSTSASAPFTPLVPAILPGTTEEGSSTGVATHPPLTVTPWPPCDRASSGGATTELARSRSQPSITVDACTSGAAHRTTPHSSDPEV